MFERELHLETKQSGVPSDVLSAAVHRAADNETSPISLRQIVLQARLSVGPSGDRYEREAMPWRTVSCGSCGHGLSLDVEHRADRRACAADPACRAGRCRWRPGRSVGRPRGEVYHRRRRAAAESGSLTHRTGLRYPLRCRPPAHGGTSRRPQRPDPGQGLHDWQRHLLPRRAARHRRIG